MTPEERNQAHLEERCQHWKMLDKLFNRDENSSLHHNRRCVLCREHTVIIRQSATVHPIILR